MHQRCTVLPLTIGHTIRECCAALAACGGPQVTDEALDVFHRCVRLHTESDIVGKYGAHSASSLASAQAFDASGEVTDRGGAAAPTLWLCGHFVAKAYAVMERDLLADPSLKAMLWQTKSAVQPRGKEDEWAKLKAMDATTRRWADEGAAQSIRRPGKVDLDNGSADDYRPLMTRVDLGQGVE